MYKISREYQREYPVINGKEFNLETLEAFEEILASEFGELIMRTTGGNGGSSFEYTEAISQFKVSKINFKTIISKKLDSQYYGNYFLWYDGVVIFSLRSYYGSGNIYLKANVCGHDFKTEKLGRCYTKTYCTKCDYSYTTDSSD